MAVYTLMNKTIPILELELMASGRIGKILKEYPFAEKLKPVILYSKLEDPIILLDKWWSGRSIPANRPHLRDYWEAAGMTDLPSLIEKSLGLSLSDQYWLRPDPSITWESVNFFHNEFSEDVGNLLVTGEGTVGSLMTPDNTTDGIVKKQWKIFGGIRHLIKGSVHMFPAAEPFREVLACKIAKRLFVKDYLKYVVPYFLIFKNKDVEDEKEVFCACPNFVTVDTEFVSFNQIRRAHTHITTEASYEFISSFYRDTQHVLNLMILLDYIMLNTDRHTGNFGLLRDVNTGDFIRPAPVFDTGFSLFANKRSLRTDTLKPKTMFKDFEDIPVTVPVHLYKESIDNALSNLEDDFWTAFKDNDEGEERLNKLLEILYKRVQTLRKRC